MSQSSTSIHLIEDAYLKPAPEVLRELRVQASNGLTADEVKKRQEKFGKNSFPLGRKQTALSIFFERFRDPIVIILVIAAVVSLMLDEVADAIIVAAAILLDAMLSFFQVWRTERTLEKIKQHVQQFAIVKREGQSRRLASEELAVGDIIELQAGEKIPADARLISANGLLVQEAPLTGESEDVTKHTTKLPTRAPLANRNNMVYMGTAVVSGSAHAVITATGIHTEYGKIAQILTTEASPITPLRQKLQRSSLYIGWIIIGLVALLSIISFLQGKELAETIRTAVTLIVSAIPEDLTMILTIALTVGVTRILRHKGVVRQLASGETLGAATVICTDKTGTLTKGEMTAIRFDFLQGSTIGEHSKIEDPFHKLALIALAIVPDAHRVSPDKKEYIGSATERTALAFAEHFGFNQISLRNEWRRRSALHFSAQWKYRASVYDHPTQPTRTLFVLGAPDILLEKSTEALNWSKKPERLTQKRRKEIEQKITELSSKGHRLLGVAMHRSYTGSQLHQKNVKDMIFLGTLLIDDPIRPEVRAALKETEAAGVQVKIVTGDHEETARAVARNLGMTVTSESMCNGSTLENMSDQELSESIERIVIFSRVTPLDKQRIVRVLQSQKHVVAMTGDGVNDAVALKSADIGIAMGSGRDIAKDAADLILLDDNFVTIVAAIREGRVVRDNIRKVIGFLLATNAAEVSLFLTSIVTGLPFPLLPAQILWINLVTDGTSDLALSLEPQESNVMRRGPEQPDTPLLGRDLLAHIGFSGLVMTIGALVLYYYAYNRLQLEIEYARTVVFTFLSMSSLISVWSWRSVSESIIKRGLWQNPWVPVSLAASASLQLLAVYMPTLQSFFNTVPLNRRDWILILGMAAITLVIIDMRKLVIKWHALYMQKA